MSQTYVAPTGSIASQIAIIGEAPGRHELLEGKASWAQAANCSMRCCAKRDGRVAKPIVPMSLKPMRRVRPWRI